MGKSTINGPFSIAILNYQRVWEILHFTPHLFFSGEIPMRRRSFSGDSQGPGGARRGDSDRAALVNGGDHRETTQGLLRSLMDSLNSHERSMEIHGI